jgi:hypothetical protein
LFLVDSGPDRLHLQLCILNAKLHRRVAMAASIKVFQQDYGDKAAPGYVVHPGDIRLPLGPGVMALPFAEL